MRPSIPGPTVTQPDLEAAEGLLGYHFQDRDLLARALMHRSAAGGADARSYERLEFLGDRVLGLIVAEMLYERFPKEPEGFLARRHAALVRREALARVARDVGLGAHVVMSRGEEEAGGRESDAILSDACEAILGAAYLDGGIAPPAAFIKAHWPAMMEEAAAPPKDAKTALQEWAQQRGLPLPAYETVGTEGPDHSPVFTVQVSVEGHSPAQASGPSKRVAAQAAAAALLETVS